MKSYTYMALHFHAACSQQTHLGLHTTILALVLSNLKPLPLGYPDGVSFFPRITQCTAKAM